MVIKLAEDKRPQGRSGRDLYMMPVADRLNDQFRFIDTMIVSMTDSFAYLPPRARHILWLKLASAEQSFLETVGLPLENGVLVHWSMWPDDLGDYAQACAIRMSRQQLDHLEPKNVAMASAIRQAEISEQTARLQIQLAQHLIQLTQMGAETKDLAQLFSKNKYDKEAIGTVLENAESEIANREQQMMHQQMMQQQMMQEQMNGQSNLQPQQQIDPVDEELKPTPQNIPTGPCPYCGKVKPYVMGEDEDGLYIVESCQDCLPQSGIEGINMGELIDSLDPVLNDEQLLEIAEHQESDWENVDEIQEMIDIQNAEPINEEE
tara:strand:+ start:6348 stop:7307 length:960 start_codon:yes stop_codon:yes gene_type:complete